MVWLGAEALDQELANLGAVVKQGPRKASEGHLGPLRINWWGINGMRTAGWERMMSTMERAPFQGKIHTWVNDQRRKEVIWGRGTVKPRTLLVAGPCCRYELEQLQVYLTAALVATVHRRVAQRSADTRPNRRACSTRRPYAGTPGSILCIWPTS